MPAPKLAGITVKEDVKIVEGTLALFGDLHLPEKTKSLIIFAHGSGSSRKSPRNRYVAQILNAKGIGTLLADLLTLDEEEVDNFTREFRFDIPLLSKRLMLLTRWARENPDTSSLTLGYFGASTGAAAALIAAADMGEIIKAVVSRGGRPDLAGEKLSGVFAPTLFIVGGWDDVVIELNKEAIRNLGSKIKELKIVEGATHLFEEPGKLEIVASLSAEWFSKYLI